MQTEAQRERTMDETRAAAPETQTCPGCRAAMPVEMRFCRLCGYRLGEGVAEYAETMRFADSIHASAFGGRLRTDESLAKDAAQTSTLGDATMRPIAPVKPRACNTKNSNWVVWVVLAIVIFSASGGGIFSLSGLNWSNMFDGGSIINTAPASRIGVRELTNAPNEGGALIDVVTPPGAPLDRAGLIGGDAITEFDGRRITSASDLRESLAATPIGKTVEIAYTRDGEMRRAAITTISADEMERLDDVFDDRPEGEGVLGISDYDRVAVPGANLYGVEIEVQRNRPADIAGLRTGDIIIEFGGVPVRTARELVARIDRSIPGNTVPVVIIRDGQRMEIPVRMGRK